MSPLTRRGVIVGGGALILGFSISPTFAQEAVGEGSGAVGDHPRLPGSLKKAPVLESWIRVDASGSATVFTGKAELGQGIKTALTQVAAEELDLPLDKIRIQTADTGMTPDEGYTAGSHSMQDSGSAIRAAAAQVRSILVAEAARRSGVTPDKLRTENGAVIGPDGRRTGYGALVADDLLHVDAMPDVALKDPALYRIVNRPVLRLDIPAKVTGGAAYVQDLRLRGMVHARVIRPPSYGAKLVGFDAGSVEHLPGVIKVVHDGDFLAVVADKEFRAVQAMRSLAATAHWSETAALPQGRSVPDLLSRLKSDDIVILDRRLPAGEVAGTIEATYSRPYQAHGSIGPSCAVAHLDADRLTVWTHTQGVFPDRQAIAEMLSMPLENVRCVHTEGAGCYGHNGADDAAGDAAIIARALPGRPVRVQLMREQEAAWEPFGRKYTARAAS
jgi:CO/xanthine dehydrogenase Mo-binding subunit